MVANLPPACRFQRSKQVFCQHSLQDLPLRNLPATHQLESEELSLGCRLGLDMSQPSPLALSKSTPAAWNVRDSL